MNEKQQQYRVSAEDCQRAEAAAQAMERMLNSYSYKGRIQEFVRLLRLEHRTNQQSFTALCVAWLESVARDEHGHDGRNEASYQLAKEFVELVPERLRHLPLI